MANKETNVFDTLNNIDVSKYVEKKGKFNYLSWSYAVQELLKVCPKATWDVHIFKGQDGADQPYMKNGTGAYVQVSVNVDDVIRTQVHPVLDNYNKSIKEPDAFQINTSIQRCLAKAIALHGLGLYIYAGEDLPEISKEPEKKMTGTQKATISNILNSENCPLTEDERNNTLKWLESDRTEKDASNLIKKLDTKISTTVNLGDMVDGVLKNEG